MKEFEEIEIVAQMCHRRHVFRSKGRVTPVDDGFQIVCGDFVRRYVQAEDLKGQLGI